MHAQTKERAKSVDNPAGQKSTFGLELHKNHGNAPNAEFQILLSALIIYGIICIAQHLPTHLQRRTKKGAIHHSWNNQIVGDTSHKGDTKHEVLFRFEGRPEIENKAVYYLWLGLPPLPLPIWFFPVHLITRTHTEASASPLFIHTI